MSDRYDEQQLERLLAHLVDETATLEELADLEQMLLSNPAMRKRYVHYLDLHSELQVRANEGGLVSPRAPVFGFLGDVGRHGFGFVADHVLRFSVLAGLIFVVAVALWSSGLGRSGQPRSVAANKGSVIADQKTEIVSTVNTKPEMSTLPVAGPATFCARLVRAKDCRWTGQSAAPVVGQSLPTGQPLSLASGVAEIEFDIGVKVILQSPAAFQLLSANSAQLYLGKATVEIKNERARGFKILTAEATVVDQGTEFGIEVPPGGGTQVHVFKGRVDVDRKAGKGQVAPPTQRLVENVGARVESGEDGLTLVEGTGESFIRSMDQIGRDQHVIAYWRFEDQPFGAIIPDTKAYRRRIRATTDSSFNGNDLFAFSYKTRPCFSGDVPAAIVPQTSAANRGCLDNSAPLQDNALTRDLHTHSRFSHAAPLDIQKITPAQWTIEASVKPLHLRSGCQTFVVRDGTHEEKDAVAVVPSPPRLAFQITAEDHFAVHFRDGDNRIHEAVAAKLTLQEGHWFHTAASSDGRVLQLYVDALDDRGYQLQATTALPLTGSTALGKANDDCQWSIGRGRPVDLPGEWFQGSIDEVRVSDVALRPSDFLFAKKAIGVNP